MCQLLAASRYQVPILCHPKHQGCRRLTDHSCCFRANWYCSKHTWSWPWRTKRRHVVCRHGQIGQASPSMLGQTWEMDRTSEAREMLDNEKNKAICVKEGCRSRCNPESFLFRKYPALLYGDHPLPGGGHPVLALSLNAVETRPSISIELEDMSVLNCAIQPSATARNLASVSSLGATVNGGIS